MHTAHPDEFRGAMVAVVNKREAPITQMAQDYGISESTCPTGFAKSVIEDAGKPSVTASESTGLREARKRIRLLEQEAEVVRRQWPTKRLCLLDRQVRAVPPSRSRSSASSSLPAAPGFAPGSF